MSSPTPPTELAAALRLDQRRRWRGGERPLAEEYLARHPELVGDAEAAVDLIFNEVLLREELGESPGVDEYRRRFPGHAEVLAAQMGLHSAVMCEPTMQVASGEGSPSPAPAGWPFVPGYEVLAEVGRGGMGVVYKARHLALNRVVALKCVLAGRAADTMQLVRFRQEAELAARLHHPNVVQIHEVGSHDGSPYLALEFVDGPNLAQLLGGRPVAPRDAARMVEPLARAVEAAHDKGIVHRDLKPANVLLAAPLSLAPQARAIGEYTPKITDFGLARRIADDARLTQTGAIVGTPSYMAPEQARAGGQVGPAADVYALGAILYECLTGRPPFQAATVLEALQAVLDNDPASPSALTPGLPRDLVTICLKCLQKKPEQRYVSAAALAEDLRRFQAGEPIAARPVGGAERAWRWARRNPGLAGTLGVIAGLLAVIAVGSSIGVVRLRGALNEWREKEREGQERLYESLIAQAHANRLSRRAGQRFRSLELLDQAREIADRLELPATRLRQLENATVAALAMPDLALGPEYDLGGAAHAEFSRDGRLVATADNKEVTVRDLRDDRVLGRAGFPGAGTVVLALHPMGRYVATSGHDEKGVRWAVIWRLTPSGLEEVRRVPDGWAIAFQADGPLVAIGRHDLVVVNLDTGARRDIPTIPTRELTLDVHPRLPLVAVSSYHRTPEGVCNAQVFNASTGEVRATIRLRENGQGVAWSPDGRFLAICEQSNVRLHESERLHETDSHGLVRRIAVNTGGGPVPTFNPRGDRLLISGWDGTWQLLDVFTGQALFQTEPILRRRDDYFIPSFTQEGTLAGATLSAGKTSLLRVGDGREFRTLQRPASLPNMGPYGVALLAKDRVLAVTGLAGRPTEGLALFDLETGEELATSPRGMSASADHHRGCFYTVDDAVRRWPIRRDGGGVIRIGPPEPVPMQPYSPGLRVSPDGDVFATANRQAGAYLLQVGGGKRPIHLPVSDVRDCVISPDSRWAATVVHVHGAVQVWNARDGALIHTLTGEFTHAVFSPNREWLLCLSSLDKGALYAVKGWEKKRTIERGFGAISSDSRWMALDDNTGTIRLEGLEDGKLLAVLEPPDPGVHTNLALTADNSQLIATKHDKGACIRIWDLRLIGQQLRDRGLGKDWPTFRPAAPAAPMAFQFDAGGLAPKKAGAADVLDRLWKALPKKQ
jgi:eukaryotic-like serine/threonine-protein kinase